MPDGIFYFLTNSQLLTLVAVLEFSAAAAIWFLHQIRLEAKLFIVAWLAALFSIYRLGLIMSGDPTPCKCFGDLFGWIGLPDHIIKGLSAGMLLYLLVPSLAWIWLRRKIGAPTDITVSPKHLI